MSRPETVLFDGSGTMGPQSPTTWTGRSQHASDAASRTSTDDGFVDLVMALDHSGSRMGVVTCGETAHATRRIAAIGLTDQLPVVVGTDCGLPCRPDPAMLLEACARLEVDPAGCASLGDCLDGVRAARAAGFALALVHVPAGVGLPSWSGEADAVLRRFGDLASAWGDPARVVDRI